MAALVQNPSLGIYVHVPFCAQQCTYCDFYTLTDPQKRHPLFSQYLELCMHEARLWRESLPGEHGLATIYLGGGTPSLMPPEEIAQLIRGLQELWPVDGPIEITLETQPGTLGRDQIIELNHAGINRFSVGAQTFDDETLTQTRRRHSAEQTRETARWIKETPARLGIDLIYGWPGQSLDQWRDDLAQTLELEPDHVSAYELTFHPDTRLHLDWTQNRIAPCDDDHILAMHHIAESVLTEGNFEHYEISNYALPGARSKHNTAYWTLQDFLGLGVAAHGFIAGDRYENPSDINQWNQSLQTGRLPPRVQPSDDPMIDHLTLLHMTLRSKEGCNRKHFQELAGWDPVVNFSDKWDNLRDEKLGDWNEDRVWLTANGWLISDLIIEKFLTGARQDTTLP